MSLHEVWEAAASSPFHPAVPKDYQLFVGFLLIFIGLVLTVLFGLNRSLTSVSVYGIPASVAFGFGAVYTICGVGLYAMESPPIFTALSTSTRQLYLLLRCIAFTQRAEVYITPEGLRFTVEEAHTVQGSTMLEKSLFSSYSLKLPEDVTSVPAFQINISAFLETLQIFGTSETNSSFKHHNGGLSSSYAAAFSTPALNLGGTCRISYASIGAPLSITIDEGSVKTTCEMNTYELPSMYDEDIEIPLDRSNLTLKVIMKSVWLADAIAELSTTSPDVLVLNASSSAAPFLALEGQGGPFGDNMVDFTPGGRDSVVSGNVRNSKQPQATEIFTVRAPRGSHGRVKQSYKFDLIKKAGRAMQLASKVSIRQDHQGVLSLQFMIEGLEAAGGTAEARDTIIDNTGSGRVSFIDFRFVALFEGEESDDQEDAEEEDREESGDTQSPE